MTQDLTSYKFACIVARFLDEKIAKDISILNISNVSSFADYFVICTAGSPAQMHALYEAACEEMAKLDSPPVKCEGMKNPDWALVDFGGVMLHIFSTQMRDFYGLDNLGAEATTIEIETIDEV